MAFEVVRSIDENVWRRFIAEHPRASAFYTPEMFEVYSRTAGHEPQLWAAVDRCKCIHAMLLPVRVTLMNGRLSPLTSRNVVYGSELHVDGPAGEEALDELLRAYVRDVRGESLFTELRHLHDATNVQPIFAKHGFAYEESLNYLVDLSRPLDEVMEHIARSTRKRLRRELARKRIEIVEIERREQLPDWYALLEMSFRHAAVPLADVSLFEAAFDVLRPKGMIRFLLARHEGTPLACSAELYYKKSIYAWFNGMNRSINTYNANDLIVWHILKGGVEEGYEVYDFGGAGSPRQRYGVRDYKSKFGGELVNFGRNVHVHRPALLWMGKAGYACCRRFLFGSEKSARRTCSNGAHA